MLKVHFPFFGQGATHGDSTTSLTFTDVIKHSAQALIGRREAQATPPAEDLALIEAGHERTEASSFPPPSHKTSRLPSDSPLRADIGLLPLDNF